MGLREYCDRVWANDLRQRARKIFRLSSGNSRGLAERAMGTLGTCAGRRCSPAVADRGYSQNAFQLMTGGGMDYRVHALISLRAEADYVFTHFFEQTQTIFRGRLA